MPNFVKQRDAYEVRERPSRTYSWVIFMISNIIVEIPWNALMAVIIYFCMYYVRLHFFKDSHEILLTLDVNPPLSLDL